MLLVLVCMLHAWAGPAEDVVRQREVVEAAAAAVAQARADGAKRSEVGDRMKVYREAAEGLEALEAPLAPDLEAERVARRAAMDTVSQALAEDRPADDAREVLAAWLGAPATRLGVLEGAAKAAQDSPVSVGQAIALDVLEQASALSVLLAFDAARALRAAQRLELRANALRRPTAGQSPSVAAEVESVQLLAEAADLRGRQTDHMRMRDQVLVLRDTTRTLLELP